MSLEPSTAIASLKVAAVVVPVFVLVVFEVDVLVVELLTGSPVVGSVVVLLTGRPVFGSIVVVLVELLLVVEFEVDEKTFAVSPFTWTVVVTPTPLSGFSSSNGTWWVLPALSV